MAELTQKELLQPSLLDRLTDEEPSVTVEPRMKRVLSPARLRECVRRDLSWLFNTTNLASLVPGVARLPLVAGSVLNYGLPDLTGSTASSIDVREFERLLRNAIWSFEPRLIPNSVRVHLAVNEKEMNHNAMVFSVEAELWAQPIPLRLFFRTEVDLEGGEVNVTESGRAEAY